MGGDRAVPDVEGPARLAELLPPARVLTRPPETGADPAAGARRDREPALVEPVHRDLEALALLADEVLARHLDVLEEELARRARPDPELVLGLGRCEARPVLLEHEGRDPLVLRAWIRLREHER